MFELEKLARKNVLNLKPYSSARDDFKGIASVYLDANENPYGTLFNRYPDPHQNTLKQKISAIKKIPVNQIFLGNGSDEPIDLLIRAFCEPGVDNVLIPQPTYGMYTVSAEINNVKIKTVKLTADFDLDVESTTSAWDDQTKLIFLCSPNNPSGNLLSSNRIRKILETFKGIVVVDEAYIDFTHVPGFIPLLGQYPNLVILQTLSKAWSMAALRVGMCFASQEIIALLNKIKPPYNISLLSQKTAEDGLNNEITKNEWVAKIIQERKNLAEDIKKLRIVKKVYPSDANFLLVKVIKAKEVYQKLVECGIIVRDRSNVVLCEDCLRITVGTEKENEALLNELNTI
ncbi:MAG: histidinol-phosphate transaminase [Cyclobacteriaceae bacterium]|nr:histidinol-phosphate transaminase [Cyclobacteriaceae bacterium]